MELKKEKQQKATNQVQRYLKFNSKLIITRNKMK